MNHLQNAMECILFAHGEPVKRDDLAKVLQVDPSLIEKEIVFIWNFCNWNFIFNYIYICFFSWYALYG